MSLADIEPVQAFLVALVTAVGLYLGNRVVTRGQVEASKLTVDAGAYERAENVTQGSFDRMTAELAHYRQTIEFERALARREREDREQEYAAELTRVHTDHRAELDRRDARETAMRAELDRFEAQVRQLMDELHEYRRRFIDGGDNHTDSPASAG